MTLALHPVEDPSRYGVVVTEPDGAVTAFIEKPAPGITVDSVTINAGTYVVEPEVLDLIPSGRAVSVEYDVFPRLVGAGLYARSFEGYWRDIGTPQSYLGANLERMPPEGLIDPTALGRSGAPRCAPPWSARAAASRRARTSRHSVLLAGAVVAEGRTVDNQVVGTTGEPVW